MSREPEAIVAQRGRLGAALATFRQAAELSQAQVGAETNYDRTSINKSSAAIKCRIGRSGRPWTGCFRPMARS